MLSIIVNCKGARRTPYKGPQKIGKKKLVTTRLSSYFNYNSNLVHADI